MSAARQAGSSADFTIPDVGELSLSEAALAYADAGFYILPVARGKHPGSIVGKGWQFQSTTDPEQIEQWWDENPDAGIAIHTGASGLTFFDLDIDVLPNRLDWLKTGIVQLSRSSASERGHYGFFTGDEIFTNSKLNLSGAHIGEIKSGNSVIIAAPSPHVKADDGGLYRWRSDDIESVIPKLPSEARKHLRPLGTRKVCEDSTNTAMAGGFAWEATDESVKNSIKLWQSGSRYENLSNLAKQIRRAEAGTRDLTRDLLRVAASEARIGFYTLADAITDIREAMIASYEARGESGKFDDGEFHRLVQNGVGYALSRDHGDISAEANRDYGAHHEEGDFEDEVAREVRKLEVRAEARSRFDGSSRAPFSRTVTSLSSFLAQPSNPTPMRIEKLMPDGGRVVFSAPYKAGKTTTVGNLIRSLVDGDRFLDVFEVKKRAQRLVLIDNELSADMVRDWIRDQGIRNTDAVADVICLRGEVSMFDILNKERRGEWAKWLRDLGCDYLIFDCLRPVLDALGLDENHDAGRFLTAFDELLAEAGTGGDATIVHHMGHSGERSRGDSRIQDWPDAIWKIVRQDPNDETSQRYFSATGRDVEVSEGQLIYDKATRHLTYSDTNRSESKQQIKASAAHGQILLLLRQAGKDGLSAKSIEDQAIKVPNVTRQAVRSALEQGEKSGELAAWKGNRNANMYALGSIGADDD